MTTEGRILAMGLMVAGVGMFGGLGGLAASLFLQGSGPRAGDNPEILARLDTLQAKLDALLRASGSSPS